MKNNILKWAMAFCGVMMIGAVCFNIIVFTLNHEETYWVPVTNLRFTLGALHRATTTQGNVYKNCLECQQSFPHTLYNGGWTDCEGGVFRELIAVNRSGSPIEDSTLIQYCLKVKTP